MRTKASRNTRDEILDAAEQIVEESGATTLTIDAVAARSGFSKGGVLYNFPTKNALIEGMVRRMAVRFAEDIERESAKHAGHNCPTMMAMIDVSDKWLSEKQTMARALLPAHASNPNLLEPIVELKASFKRKIDEETKHSPRAHVVWSALDGLHFTSAHGLALFTEAERSQILKELRALLSA